MKAASAWRELAVLAAAFVVGMEIGQRVHARQLDARVKALEGKWAHPCVLALPGDLIAKGRERR